ncbi:hypothetical protein PybrP1_012780 [[Pythium] brassicae (nom. inval.)]|nr:hypothetical protein PybrP1_012780 [[Pythium] brassicae (nom. inval.)]
MKRRPHAASRAVEFLPRRFFFLALRVRCVSLDDQLTALEALASGVRSELQDTVLFCDFLSSFLASIETEMRAIHLICRWRLLHLGLSPLEALAPFEHLTFLFPAMAAPLESLEAQKLATLQLVGMLKQHRVAVVVRLQQQAHDGTQFAANGIELVDLSAAPAEPAPPLPAAASEVDGLDRFLRACEATLTVEGGDGVLAVHADAGSGRAVAFVGCYLMKHLTFTSREAFGWLHACGLEGLAHSHQLVLDRLQARMWRDGAEFRRLASEDEESGAPLARSALLRSAVDPLHISIGNISLGRHSLFGTKAAVGGADKRATKPSTSRAPHAPAAPRDRDESGSALAATQAAKRRPLTQGSVGRRPRVRNGESVHLRADFAQMHKFLHQTGSVGSLVPPRASGARADSAGPTAVAAMSETVP